MENISSKDVNTSPMLVKVKEDIANEIESLNNVRAFYSVKESIKHSANTTKNYINYSRYINKLGELYQSNIKFKEKYKKDFQENYGIDLTDNDIVKITALYDLVQYINNGIILNLEDEDNEELQITKFTPPKEIFSHYLKTLKIDNIGIYRGLDLSFAFRLQTITPAFEGETRETILNNYDLYYFIYQMAINLILNPLICVKS